MLKQRIITAVILVAVLLAALFAKNPVYWTIMISVMLLAGFYEWLRFCQIDNPIAQALSYLLFISAAYGLGQNSVPPVIVIGSVCAIWMALFAFTTRGWFAFINIRWVKLMVGISTLATAGWAIIEIRTLTNGPFWVLGFFLIVVAADVGAYFCGKRFGKRKLAPSVSPGKTVEGFVGGLLLVVTIYIPLLFFLFPAGGAAGLLITAILTAVSSVGGDLFESKLKRHVGLKDSSQILPGHGGILDRVDSLMAGLPVFALGLLLLGIWT
ncbi:MAG: phosphatidate cytidylyltransferase [Gammaproteobacteria bacterium]|nr:phosphatidate cytidylyltransferase [Gammaproteobacteria bacterium]